MVRQVSETCVIQVGKIPTEWSLASLSMGCRIAESYGHRTSPRWIPSSRRVVWMHSSNGWSWVFCLCLPGEMGQDGKTVEGSDGFDHHRSNQNTTQALGANSRLLVVRHTYTHWNEPIFDWVSSNSDNWRVAREPQSRSWRQKPTWKGAPGDGGVSNEIATMEAALRMSSDEVSPQTLRPQILYWWFHVFGMTLKLLCCSWPVPKRQHFGKSDAPNRESLSKDSTREDALSRGFGPLCKLVILWYTNMVSGVAKFPKSCHQIGRNWETLAMVLESQVEQNGLTDCEFFLLLFTVTTTAEAAFWKGSSHSQELLKRTCMIEFKESEIMALICWSSLDAFVKQSGWKSLPARVGLLSVMIWDRFHYRMWSCLECYQPPLLFWTAPWIKGSIWTKYRGKCFEKQCWCGDQCNSSWGCWSWWFNWSFWKKPCLDI